MINEILLSIVTVTSPNAAVLRQPAEPVTSFGEHTEKFFHSMVATMRNAGGIGIAAQQVGETMAVFAVDVSQCVASGDTCALDRRTVKIRSVSPLAFFNPKITKVSEETNVQEEGCLSIPGVRAKIRRANSVAVRYQDEKGDTHELECGGIFARCIQHEEAHLRGILFTDDAVSGDE
ncbi:MAG: peptide deformylase [Puniceicoccales bacterium]|jgi:peptide deformylase|nr:peptide deformylase [Puniceicoccales bacterium]